MKRVLIRENEQGRYHLVEFGAAVAGEKGKEPFTLVVESRSRDLFLEFPLAKAFDLFSRLDIRSEDFGRNRIRVEDFLRVTTDAQECVVEAGNGSLYDFFKERAAAGHCVIRSVRPVAFYWRGNSESDVA
jgi:hypothetical protein